ncbi:hypothetical protein IWQ61_010212, partial [Dispira simplex]
MSTSITNHQSTSSTDSLDGRFQELIDLTKQLNTIELSDSEYTPASHLGTLTSTRKETSVEVVDLTRSDSPVVRKEYRDRYAAGNLVAPSLLRSRGWHRIRSQTPQSTVLVTSWQAPPQPIPREMPSTKMPSSSSKGTRSVNLTSVSDKRTLASIVSTLDQHFRAKLHKEPTPDKLKISLKAYQQMGLHWLLSQERSRVKGGILGDDMGLGKTVQIISLLLSTKFPRQSSVTLSSETGGPTLVVVPKVVMGHWEEEIYSKCHTDSLTVWQYYGFKKKSASALKHYDVVLVTYQTLGLEYKRHLDNNSRSPLLEITWQRVVLDEAHFIKNRQSSLSKACLALSATYRWCVTGTPVQNDITELYPYLKFLRYPHAGLTLPMFRKLFGITTGQILNPQHIHATLDAIFLRRTKALVFGESGTEKLPPKTVQTHGLDFLTAEQWSYNFLEAQVKKDVQKAKDRGKQGSLTFYLEYITLLRQICNHQRLLPSKHLTALPTATPLSEPSQWVEYLSQCPLNTLQELVRPNGVPNCPCSTCGKLPVRNPVLFSPCGHVHCFECACGWAQTTTKPTLRCKYCCNQPLSGHRGLPWELAKVFSTLLSNQNDHQMHNGLNAESHPSLEDELANLTLGSTTKSKTGPKRVPSQGHFLSLGKSSFKSEEAETDHGTSDSPLLDKTSALSQTSYCTTSALTRKDGDIDRAIRSIRGSLRYRYYCTLFRDGVHCTKLDFLISLLDSVITKQPDDKLVVFSQYVAFLKIIEVCLNRLGVHNQLYYGEL